MVSMHLRAAATMGADWASAPSRGPIPITLAPELQLQVVDAIAENGAKLVDIRPSDLSRLRAAQPGLRVAPLIEYEPAMPHRSLSVRSRPSRASGTTVVRVLVRTPDAQPVVGACVVAYARFTDREGDDGTTDRQGAVLLSVPRNGRVERLYVVPKAGYWPWLAKNVTITSSLQVVLDPIRFPANDCLRFAYGNAPDGAGQGVVVAIVDTGCGPHRDLDIQGGASLVLGSNLADYHDNGEQHGTHVAGIIAARGDGAAGARGLAPGAALRSYRVFAKPGETTDNFEIGKAIDLAVQEGCDLINLSLKQLSDPVADIALHEAIEAARNEGCLAIAAAGNGERQSVSFPARDDLCIAVTAMGRVGTTPASSTSAAMLADPKGTDRQDFFSAMSNFGPEVDLTGPGVGVISTVPGDSYAVKDGTSMACAAVTGVASRLLAMRRDIMDLKNDDTQKAERSAAIARLLLSSAKPLGFGTLYEGQGRPT